MNGLDMLLMERRFRKAGYSTQRFKYNSIHHSPIENAQRLAKLIDSIKADQIHFICHSLGGLVLRQYFNEYALDQTGRIVMLGTPNNTSRAAKTLNSWPGGSMLLGKSIKDGLLGPLPDWDQKNQLGIIAGNLRLGMGLIIPDIPRPNDGTVSVVETRLDGMQDHITMPVSHFGLLLSNDVFKQCRYFIEHGRFKHT